MSTSTSDLRLHTRRTFQDEEVEARILQALRAKQRSVTLADLVAATGLNAPQIEPVLRSMIMRYTVSLRVSEDGDISYLFDPALQPTDDDAHMRRYRFRNALWSGFKVFYKVLIVVVLISYVIVFLALMVMMIFAASNQRDEDRGGGRSSRSGPSPIGGNFWFWYWMMGNRRQRAPRRSRYEPLPKEDPRPLWEKVFSFVFGLDTSDDDPLVDRKRMLAYLVRQKGVVAPMELSAHTGWSPEASEQESSKLIAHYNGGVEILPDGQTLFLFDDLRSAVPPGTAPLPLFYQRFERRASNSGNPPSTDILIGALNLFILVSALFIAPTHIIPFLVQGYGVQSVTLLYVLLVLLPGLFSVSFFAIPMIRNRFTTRKENDARKARNARRLVMQSVYKRVLRGEVAFRESDILNDALSVRLRSDEAVFAREKQNALTHALRTMAHEWGADQDVNNDGERVYNFSSLAQQYQHAQRFRNQPTSHKGYRLDEEFQHFDELLAETEPSI